MLATLNDAFYKVSSLYNYINIIMIRINRLQLKYNYVISIYPFIVESASYRILSCSITATQYLLNLIYSSINIMNVKPYHHFTHLV